jgi:SAM-dependent methyltransferase
MRPRSPRDSAAFYEGLAPLYHLVYADWPASVERQGEQLDAVLREELGRSPDDPAPGEVLDAACGIGTQSLGLAARSWRVTASDLSPAAVERAGREAARRGLDVAFSVADLRAVHDHHRRTFEAVLACDNSLPHLLTDADLLAAVVQLRRATAPGGVCVVSMRDYAARIADGAFAAPSRHPYGTRGWADREIEVVQEWNPRPQPDGRLLYDLALHLVGEPPGETTTFTSRCYAVPIDRLLELMAEAGFDDPRRLDGRFFQPLLVGRAGAAGSAKG